jgi:hypothetical protein
MHSKVLYIQQHLVVHLVLHIPYSSIDLLYITMLCSFQQQFGLLHHLFTHLDQVLAILAEL